MKTFFLIWIISFLNLSIIYSQFKRVNQLPKNNSITPTLNHAKEFNVDILEADNFRNHLDKTINIQNFDSTTVIDSIIYVQSGAKIKIEFTYNSNKKIISETTKSFEGNQWYIHEQKDFTYDIGGNIITLVIESMTGKMRQNFSYDDFGNIKERLDEEWNGSNWVNSHRHTHTYDLNNNRILTLIEYWYINQNTGVGIWQQSESQNYTYYDNGEMKSFLRIGGGYKYRISYNYTTNEIDKTELYERWENNQWINQARLKYAYDLSGNYKLKLREKWIGDVWEMNSQYTYTYNDEKKLILLLEEKWDTNQWTNYHRAIYDYNNEGNVDFGTSERWIDNSWEVAGGPFSFQDSVGKSYSFWANYFNVFYGVITDIHNIESTLRGYSLSQNYPNPFNPSTKINYSIKNQSFVTLKVFDVLGREIETLVNKEESQGSYSIEFNASGLTSGIYFYRIQAGEFVDTKKMILMK